MKKGRGFLTIGLFALGATLLCFSVVGSSRAALSYFSETYGAEVSMLDIGVSLLENGEPISYRNYTPVQSNTSEQDNWTEHTGMLVQNLKDQTDGELKLGYKYDERLSVQNTGKIDEYVRVSVYKYWEKLNDNGQWEKDPSLDSNLIELHFTDEDGSGWRKISETEERTVLFYEDILGPLPENGESEAHKEPDSNPFVDSLTLRAMPIEATVERNEYVDAQGKNVIETTYTYDNARFVLRADVDAVQTHHAADAMTSAWGVSYLG